MHGAANNYDETALDYCAAGRWDRLCRCGRLPMARGAVTPMTYYYMGWSMKNGGKDATAMFIAAKGMSPDYCFPNRLEAVLALEEAKEADATDAMRHIIWDVSIANNADNGCGYKR